MSIKVAGRLERRKCKHSDEILLLQPPRGLRDADYNAARECDELCCDGTTGRNDVFLRRHGMRHGEK